MNWYRKAQTTYGLEQTKYLLDTDEQNMWAQDDIDESRNRYNNEQLSEQKMRQRTEEKYKAPRGEGRNPLLLPLKRNPPAVKSKTEKELEQEILNNETILPILQMDRFKDVIWWLKERPLYVEKRYVRYFTDEYNTIKKRYDRLINIQPRDDIDTKNKKKKQKQYQYKINDILNNLNYHKTFLRMLEAF